MTPKTMAARRPLVVSEPGGSIQGLPRSDVAPDSCRPAIAPHRALPLPSLRYTVHLNGPGWHVIGAGEPALPGVNQYGTC